MASDGLAVRGERPTIPWRHVTREHSLYLSLFLSYIAIGFFFAAIHGQAGSFRISFYNKPLFLVIVLCLVVFFLGHCLY